MVTTMRYLLAAFLLLLAASAEAQIFGSSTVETSPAALTVSGSAFTPACPTLGGASSGVNTVIVTAATQSIAMPASCPSSSVGLFVTFNICNGKGGTAPCNGTASGPFSPGIAFGSGFEFPTSSGPYVATAASGAKDVVTCEVMGTTGPWSCGTPQYAMTSPIISWAVSGAVGGSCTGASPQVCTVAPTIVAGDKAIIGFFTAFGAIQPSTITGTGISGCVALTGTTINYDAGGNNIEQGLWICNVGTSGTPTLTITFTSQAGCCTAVEAFNLHGAATSPDVGIGQTATATGTSTTATTTGATTQASQFILSLVTDNSGGTSPSPGSGQTSIATFAGTQGLLQYSISSASLATQTATSTLSPSQPWGESIVALSHP